MRGERRNVLDGYAGSIGVGVCGGGRSRGVIGGAWEVVAKIEKPRPPVMGAGADVRSRVTYSPTGVVTGVVTWSQPQTFSSSGLYPDLVSESQDMLFVTLNIVVHRV